jgi:hypothetical protein
MNSALCLHSRRVINPLTAASSYDLVAGPQLIHHAVDLLLLVVESGRRCRPPAKPGSHGDGRRLHARFWRGRCLLLLGEGNWLNRAASTLLRGRCRDPLRARGEGRPAVCRGGWLSGTGRCPGDRLPAWQYGGELLANDDRTFVGLEADNQADPFLFSAHIVPR